MSKTKEEPARFVALHGDVTESNISDVIKKLFELDLKDATKPIHLIIDTRGGSVHEMFALYDAINAIASPVYTVGLGKIMSAGVLLLASGKHGNRRMGKHATLMIHPSWSINYGNVFQQEHDLNEHKRLFNALIDGYVKETNLTKEQINEIMKKEKNQFFTAEQAKEMGFVDEVIG
tara:strand:+ start:12020 stop:12547 length:528 start_codon:yes stop_codon:yes gene_type:complete